MNNIQQMSWLEPAYARLIDAHLRDQLPHALLLHGAAGTGRRALAAEIAMHLLSVEAGAASADAVLAMQDMPDALQSHPDFLELQPPPEKKSIAIDQVRELINFLGLTSHQKGAKVAVVFPADLLSHSAANALLKTLEEPPGNSVLVLVSQTVSRLPATVVSRCHRVRVSIPANEAALTWLSGQDKRVDWVPLLAQAGGAPIAALALHEESGDKHLQAFEQGLGKLAARRGSPAAMARDWHKSNPELWLDWLYRRVASEIREALAGQEDPGLSKSRPSGLQNAGKMLNIDQSFEVLGELCELRRLKGSGVNTELHLAKVLGHWYGA